MTVAYTTIIPFQIFNISNEENLYLPKDFIVGFAEKDQHTSENFEVEYDTDKIEIDEIGCRNWIPKRKMTGAPRPPCRTKTNIDLHKIFTTESNFIKSPAEVDSQRKVNLQDQHITESTRQEFSKLCKEYDGIISKGSRYIGKTLLVEMDIDTGDSPPIAQRLYTLPLQHAEWVKNEIENT